MFVRQTEGRRSSFWAFVPSSRTLPSWDHGLRLRFVCFFVCLLDNPPDTMTETSRRLVSVHELTLYA